MSAKKVSTPVTEESAKYAGLDNKELMLVYYKLKSQTDKLEQNLSKKRIAKPIDTPYGEGIAYIEVPQKHIDMFRETTYYKLLCSVLEKLEPIVSLLEECDGSLKELANELR